MTRLLTLATAVCGEYASRTVIEPLLADWQKELDLARARGRIAHAAAAVSGVLALIRSAITCAISEGVWIPPVRGTVFSILAIVFSVAVSTAVLLIPPMPNGMSRNLADPLAQLSLLVMSTTVLPPAFLFAMFMHRRDPRATLRHAIVGVSFAAIATTAVAITTNPDAVNRRYNTFEFQERVRARMLSAAKANPGIYRGNAYQRTLATTVEERRANYEKFQSRLAEWRKKDPPLTPAERFALVQPVLLAIVFASMGWTLGGFRRPTVARGVTWWALVFIATITMTPLLSLLVGVPMPQPAHWWMLPMFTSMTLSLMAAARKNQPARIRGDS
jgi:hypothetical protein